MPGKIKKIPYGEKFGMWTVKKFHFVLRKNLCVEATCDCGTVKTMPLIRLTRSSSNSLSCGCVRNDKVAKMMYKNGSRNHELGSVWRSMLARCGDVNHKSYKDYGGRGIMVCDEWHDFQVFVSQLPARPSKKYQLDRIDNSKGYSHGNVRWATAVENNRNKRNNRMIEFEGRIVTVAEANELSGLPDGIIAQRIYSGSTKNLYRPSTRPGKRVKKK